MRALNNGTITKTGLLLVVCLSAFYSQAYGQDAMSLFNQYSNRIYQIRIIEQASGKQAALGSGFQISGDGTIVTNYHVVSGYTNYLGRFRIEYASSDGSRGELQLVDIDVIHDLALVKRDDYLGQYLEIAGSLPLQGEMIYSLGNPHDLGLTVVPGTYNGIAAHSFYKRIHFSGSINPGMSGGPVLNSEGKVIGVNVATAGNQISFLVPLNNLSALIDRPRSGAIDLVNIDSIITGQLLLNQQEIIGELVNEEWLTSEFRGASVPTEIAEYIRCWGTSGADPDNLYDNFMSVCSQDEYIFLADSFTTGNIVYQFNWLESDELNLFQFYNMYQTQIENVYPDNYAGKDDVTNFKCHEDFLAKESGQDQSIVTKGTFCARAYKKYPGLFDVLYLGASVHESRKGLVSHFTLAGVSMDMALEFTRKFLEGITWN